MTSTPPRAQPFRRLQWQLSLSYLLVTVGALLAVELCLFVGVFGLLNSSLLSDLFVRMLNQEVVPNVRLYLEGPQPDLEGLAGYMGSYAGSPPQSSAAARDQETAVENAQNGEGHLAVIDPQRRLLWSDETRLDSSRRLDPLETSLVGQLEGLEPVLAAALAGETATNRLYTRVGANMLVALPILSTKTTGEENRVLGVLIFQLEMPGLTTPSFLAQLLPTLGVSVLLFTLMAGATGLPFGILTARRFTRRLARVSNAADAWSRGDFSTFISDSAGDELGILSRRLNAMAEQLQNLLHTRQELAAVEERNRIARDLHDSVKQQVFAAAMQIGAVRALLPDEEAPSPEDLAGVRRRLAEAERLVELAQGELTALIRELRPVALEGKGLVVALRELAAGVASQSGMGVRVQAPPPGEGEPLLPLSVQQALYRVAQEALSNAARHSAARSVEVSLRMEGSRCTLTVTDDGRGFDAAALAESARGVGLKSMRERIEALGGVLRVESDPQRGTTISAVLG